MTEFKFTNEEWREYQMMPEQGYSHRHKLEFFVNRWLAEHDRQVAEKAWDDGLADGRDRWMDAREFGDKPVNPYRQRETE